MNSAAASPPQSIDLLGRKIGDYQILRRLGRGGMAEVFLAEQTSLKRKVAIKVLRPELAKDQNYVRRFQHEAQAAASLVQANIVQIFEVGYHEGLHFIAQEYVAGVNLGEYVGRHGPLPADLAASILKQTAMALAHAGEQGIVHRDIKPENILLSTRGDVKVADFGLARVSQTDSQLDVTQAGVTMGTPLYMSPEQVEGKQLDPRSDIYSLGVTAYHILTGAPPFRSETALGVAVMHLKNPPPSLTDQRPDVPEELCDVVMWMLAKSPADRPASARELLSRLAKVVGEAESLPAPSVLAEKVSADWSHQSDRTAATQALQSVMVQSQSKRSAHWWIWPVVAVAIGLAVGVVLAVNRKPEPLLTADTAATAVPSMKSPEEQYYYATYLNSESGWKSVWIHFPPEKNAVNRYYSLRAKQQLANYYLNNSQYDLALDIYNELSTLPSLDADFIVSGLAGQAIAYDRKGEEKLAAEKLVAVLPRIEELQPTERRDEIQKLKTKYGIGVD